MIAALWLVLLVVVFLACRRSAAILDSHYGDRSEVGAVLLIGACVVVPLAIGAASSLLRGLPAALTVGLAVGAGVLTGSTARA